MKKIFALFVVMSLAAIGCDDKKSTGGKPKDSTPTPTGASPTPRGDSTPTGVSTPTGISTPTKATSPSPTKEDPKKGDPKKDGGPDLEPKKKDKDGGN